MEHARPELNRYKPSTIAQKALSAFILLFFFDSFIYFSCPFLTFFNVHCKNMKVEQETHPPLSLLLSQGFLLLQLRGHRSQTAAAETQRQQDPHRGLGQCPRLEHVTRLECLWFQGFGFTSYAFCPTAGCSPWKRDATSFLRRPRRSLSVYSSL